MSKPHELAQSGRTGCSQERGAGRGGRFRLFDPTSEAGWDDLIATHRDASFFHSKAWAAVLRNSYGHTPLYVGKADSGTICALAPVMEVSSRLTGRRGVALPFSDECRMLVPDAETAKELMGEAAAIGRERNWKYVEFRGVPEGIAEGPPAASYYGHVLNLAHSPVQVFSGFHSSVKRAIRKAERSGMSVEISNSFAVLREFYRLHCLTRKRHRVPPQPLSFFRNIHQSIMAKGHGIVALASQAGRPVAANVFFFLSGRAVFKFGASDRGFQLLRGSNLAFWEAIKWLSERGMRSLHFGRTEMAHEGLRSFKAGFGAREHRINYYRYDVLENRFQTGQDRMTGWQYWILGLLPTPILRMLGLVAYRHLD